MQCSEKPILLEALGTVSPLRRPDSCGFISIKQLSRYIKVRALIWRASERRRAGAPPSDSRMALHKQSPPGTGSSVRIRRHRRDGLCCMLKLIGRTDGWKTTRWKRKSSSSSFTFVFFFYCCFFQILICWQLPTRSPLTSWLVSTMVLLTIDPTNNLTL